MAISRSKPQIEESVFDGVVDTSPMDDEDVSRIRQEMNDAVAETMTEKEYYEVMADRHGHGEIIRQTEFAPALSYSSNRVTQYESGSAEVSAKYAISLRLLHRHVMENPRDVADAALALARRRN
jgi:DNA-binding transcriptional regulator YiaG